ncbi:MAG: hypothetical protein RBJ76_04550 [Stenomitos frigidus ULC029]
MDTSVREAGARHSPSPKGYKLPMQAANPDISLICVSGRYCDRCGFNR